jgi:uncharacterized metal-binding protein YceD (DUF177 family)
LSTPEFPRPVDVRQADGRTIELVASDAERAALARRFGLVRIDRLEARIAIDRDGDAVNASGTLSADIVQSCAVSAEDLPVTIDEPIRLRFVPEGTGANHPDEEIELDAGELDEIPYAGTSFDLGEAAAQSLALAIDPFLAGPEAETARALLRDEAAHPFAALKNLKLKD